MKDNIIIALLLLLIVLFVVLIINTPEAIDTAVKMSMVEYLELNGYSPNE